MRLRGEGASPAAPNLAAFKPYPWGDHFPDHWVSQLGHTGDERALCAKLEAALASVQGPKDAITMLRYLRARQGNLDKAASMYRNTQEWHLQTDLERRFRLREIDETIHQRFDDYWKLVGLVGRDRDGSPVLWERIGQSHAATITRVPHEFIQRHEVYSMTRLMQSMEELSFRDDRPHIYFTAIVDLDGMGLQHIRSAVLNMYKAMVRIDEDFYPEMVKRAIVVRAPWIFEKIWVIVKHFFDEGTRNKIQIAGRSNTIGALSPYIDPKYIPKALGGSADDVGGPFLEPFVSGGQGAVPEDLLEAIQRSCKEG